MTRKVVKGIVVTAVTAALLFLVYFFGREYINNYAFRLQLTSFAEPPAGSRVLVIAPHPDDETLGPGILLSRLTKKGAAVRVVVMTNGDGFTDALAISYHELKPRREDYLSFGYMRQKETLAAMALLGVPESAITFLGYPDGGLLHLWSINNWTEPYTSLRTGQNHNPYSNALSPGAPYTGASVVGDLSRIIKDFNPDYVIFPHPNDRHPDHLATYCFTKYVLNQVGSKAQQFQYLVHRGDWPVLSARHQRMFLVPPRTLAINDTDWYAFTLTGDEIKAKEQAIHKYTSQVRVMGPRLTAFDRKNELYAWFKDAVIQTMGPTSAPGGQKSWPDPSNPDFHKYLLEQDPTSDVLLSTIEGSGDLVGLYGYREAAGDVHFFLDAREEVLVKVRYVLDIITYHDSEEMGRIVVSGPGEQSNVSVTRRGSGVSSGGQTGPEAAAGMAKAVQENAEDITMKTSGHMTEITIPGKYLEGTNRYFIGATSYLFGFRSDSMAWRFYLLK